MAERHQYLTTDTPLAAYLIQSAFPLIEIQYEEKPSGKYQATFVFDNRFDPDGLQVHIALFNRGDADVNLVRYEHTKSSLLDRIMRRAQ